MPNYIIGKPEFVKNLDDWLFKNDQKNAAWIASNKSGIPPMFQQYTKPLYRGMKVNSEFMELAKNGKLTFKSFTSWSKSEKIAKGFVNDPKYSIAGSDSNIKILIKKTVPSSAMILDIHSFVMFMGVDQLEMLGLDALSADSAVKEEEILINKGVKISIKDISFI